MALVVADGLTGFALGRAYPHVGQGQLVGMVNSARQADADVLILGASTASHHYDDVALGRRLGLRVFNTGLDGRGIVFSRGLFALVAKRHAPRLVVLDVSYSDRDRTTARILAPFYGTDPVVDDVVGWSWRERVKLVSRSYRFNGLVLPILERMGSPPMTSGFEPLDGAIPDSVPWRGPPRGAGGFGPWYETQLRRLVAEVRASGATLIFVESPSWGGRTAAIALQTYERVARDLAVPFARLTPDREPELDHARLYYDRAHLNREGAKIFTARIGDLLARVLAGGPPQDSSAARRAPGS